MVTNKDALKYFSSVGGGVARPACAGSGAASSNQAARQSRRSQPKWPSGARCLARQKFKRTGRRNDIAAENVANEGRAIKP